jgi:beta-phosphoglucomutase
MKRIRAVLFDYDGVIADSMSDNYFAWKHAFRAHGIPVSRDQFYRYEGLSPLGIALNMCKLLGIPSDKYKEIYREKDEYYKTHHTFRLYPHAVSTVKKIRKQGLHTALVSGGMLPRILAATPKAVMDLFDVVVTSDSIARTKPYPDPYLKALEMLHIANTEAVVVENAPLGITAAKAAGLYCIALSTTVDCTKLADADVCVDDMAKVPALLTKLES